MIAVDTNVLVYAHRRDSPWHEQAASAVRGLAEGRAAWAIPWPCIHEFVGVVTHPRIYKPASTIEQALKQVDVWLDSPRVVLLAESPQYWPRLRGILLHGTVVGPKVHDARIAALCNLHGVRELWSTDRDFGRIRGVDCHNPLVPDPDG